MARLCAVALLLVGVSALFLTLGARGNWGFVLPYRGTRLLAMLLVGAATGVGTLLFQTITRNRILTPSLMGFDALYLLLLTGATYLGGAEALPPVLRFWLVLGALVLAALVLYGTLLRQGDLMRMILTGVIFATLFQALAGLLMRLLDPNTFVILQGSMFAQFNRVETALLWSAGPLVVLTLARVWVMRHRLDVVALGRSAAVGLGAAPDRAERELLIWIAVLVSVSIALAGPWSLYGGVPFLGLLVVHLAYRLLPGAGHGLLLPGAALIAGVVLVAGQVVLEHLLGRATPLAVVVDLIGGALFLGLILKGRMR